MSVNSPITASDRWFQGEDKTLTFATVDEAGAALTLTGFTVKFFLYSRRGAGGTLLGIWVASFVNVNGTADGARITIADTDTITAPGVETIAPSTYWYELWRTDEGAEQLLASGDAVLLQSRRRQEA